MSKHQKTTIATLMGAAALAANLLAGTPAYAGLNEVSEVKITTASNGALTVSGSLADARASADAVQYVGCRLTISTGLGNAVNCYARTASGQSASCYSASPSQALMTAVAAITGESKITFKAAATGNTPCTDLTVFNDSSAKR